MTPPPQVIDSFDGDHHFLSNFHVRPFEWRGHTAPSSEHHFMATKSLDSADRDSIYAASTPGMAKRLGRKVALRPDWDIIRLEVMRSVLGAKFADPTLRAALLDTGDALLIEGNTWHDQFWGDCSCPAHRGIPGGNHLGRTLMAVRSLQRNDPSDRWPRVAVTGHRPQDFTPDQAHWVQATLADLVGRLHSDHGTTVAISGLALGSDTWWAQAALHDRLSLWAYIPFETQGARWPSVDQEGWRDLRAAAAREVVLGDEYDVRLLHSRNDLMIRDADLIVAVHQPRKSTGGTVNAIRRARADRKTLLRVDPTARAVTLVPPGATGSRGT